jgi:hypothetical protein
MIGRAFALYHLKALIMHYESIVGPLSRVLCCLVPFAWLPALAILYAVRRLDSRNRQRNRQK